jgi:hypothetical protein
MAQQIQKAKAVSRRRFGGGGSDEELPLDPRDPDIVRAKRRDREQSGRTASTGRRGRSSS